MTTTLIIVAVVIMAIMANYGLFGFTTEIDDIVMRGCPPDDKELK